MRRALRLATFLLVAGFAVLAFVTFSTPPGDPPRRPELEPVRHLDAEQPKRRPKSWLVALWPFSAAALALLVIAGCFLLTMTAAALALGRPRIERLNTEMASRLEADYSADPRGLVIAPLDPAVVSAAAQDEQALSTTTDEVERVDVDHAPPPPPEPIVQPSPSGGSATSTPRPQDPEEPAATALVAVPTRGPADQPEPTNTPSPRPTNARAPTSTPTDHNTNTPRPPATATATARPTSTPTAVRTPTPTAVPTIGPTATETAGPTDLPPATATSVATGTPPPSTTPERTGTPPSTPTPTDSRTETPTAVRTATPTGAPTVGPTTTATRSPTAAATVVPTALPTATGTGTPTSPPTATPTATPTDPPTPTPLPPFTISVEPADQTVLMGSSASVDITIGDAFDAGGYSLVIEWDPSVLSFASVTNGLFLGSTGRTVVCLPPALLPGSMAFNCSTIGVLPGPDGSGVLATVVFDTSSAGTSAVTIADGKLTTTSGTTADAITSDGSVTVELPTPTPTETATPTSTPTPVTVTFAAAADAPVWMSNPNTNFETYPHLNVDGDAGALQRSFISFDLSSIPAGALVMQADLTLCYAVDPSASAPGHAHELRSVAWSWTESGITWNSQPGVSGAASDGVVVPASGCVTFVVDSDV